MALRRQASDRAGVPGAGSLRAAARHALLALLALPPAFVATSAQARVVTVRWTHPSPTLVTGFRVYTRAEGQAYGAPAYDGLPAAPGGVYAAQLNVPDTGTSYFRGSSYGPGGESAPSNEVALSAPAPAPACGNGVRETGEACDDGNRTSGDGCRANCSTEVCGDAILDTPREQCDDGNAASGDGCESCRSVAAPPACGNGARETGEACDDGNRTSGDGCRSNCTAEVCGDAILDTPREQCDDGNAASGDGCQGCRSVAAPPACGNGARETGEPCDDGNQANGDGCRASCSVESCGDAILDPPREQCDDGNAASGDGCESCRSARIPACGDAVRDPGEACDDANQMNGDGCRANCTVEACGDAIRDPAEACDDGNATSGDGCDAGCVVSACGNGVVAGGEGCDDGNAANGDGCDANCAPTGCGNGALGAGEQCDDGNAASGDGCDANCTSTACGNGVASEGEVCDDGNLEDGDGCSSLCQLQEEAQTGAQIRCILAVNRGVALVARVQAREQARCLADAGHGELGDMPSAFDACLGADLRGAVAGAEGRLLAAETEACVPDEPPTLALGGDRLSGLPFASELPRSLVRDLFGAPAEARDAAEAPPAARCQRQLLRGTAALFDAIWSELPGAEARKLEGRRDLPPATSDAELGAYLEEALAASRGVERRTERLIGRAARACSDMELAGLFPGCEPAHTLDLAACAVETTRCRACQLLRGTNPRLALDCDGFDDQRPNESCPSGS